MLKRSSTFHADHLRDADDLWWRGFDGTSGQAWVQARPTTTFGMALAYCPIPLEVSTGTDDTYIPRILAALSPKPTTFLVTTPRADGQQFLEWLNKHRVTDVLPKPIEMGHCKGIYHTAKLKRYPGPLCAGLAEISIQAVSQISFIPRLPSPNPHQGWVDPVLTTALELRDSYEHSANVDDGVDFHQFNKGIN